MLNNQAQLFLIFIVNGIIIGMLFDFFRILRKSFKTSDFITYLEDFIFWILTGGSILSTLFIFNNGEIRLYIFFAILIGIMIYILFFSNFMIKINVTIIIIIKKIVKKIFIYLLIPIKFICNIIKKIFYKPISFVIINLRSMHTNFYKNNAKNINIIKIKKDFKK